MCWQRHDRFERSEQAGSVGRPTPDRADLRISDADRQAVIDDLRQHTGDGRLTLDEFEERVDEALRARTVADLHTATRDLPSLHPVTPRLGAGFRFPVRPGVVAACIVVVLLMAGHWWVLIPVGFFVFGGCGPRAGHAPTRRHEDRDESMTYA